MNTLRVVSNIHFAIAVGVAVLIGVLGCSLVIGGNPEIERVRVVIFFRVVEILVAATGFKIVLSTKKISLNSNLFLHILILLSVAFLSVLVSSHLSQSIFGNYYRSDGVLTLVHLVLFSLVVAVNWGSQFETLLLKILPTFIWLMTIYILIWYGIYAFSQGYMPQLQLFLKGVWQLPNENMIAGFLLVSLPLYFKGIWRVSSNLIKSGGLLLLPIAGILATQSWGAIIAGGLGLMLFVGYKQSTRGKIGAVAGLLTILLILFLIWRQTAGNVVEGRELLFRSLFAAVGDKPILGWGWSRVDTAFESGYTKIFGFFPDLYVDKAHSLWLEYIVTTGIVGLVVYITLQISLLKTLVQKSKAQKNGLSTVMLWILVLFCLHSQTNVISIAEEVFFWLILGFCLVKVPERS